MTYPPRKGDLPLKQIKEMMDKELARGSLAWIKWTCPKCGERVVSDREGEIHLDGYTHTQKADGSECGGVYDGQLFGLLVAVPLYNEDRDAPSNIVPPNAFPQPYNEERDDASEKMERRHDRLEGGGWEES